MLRLLISSNYSLAAMLDDIYSIYVRFILLYNILEINKVC